MTGQEIYERALSYLYEYKDKDKDFKKLFLSFLGTLLQEALPYENSMRERDGDPERPVLKAAPVIADFADVVPYADQITVAALPYGVASFYFQDEGDNYRAADYRNRYIEALEVCNVAVAREMNDVY